MLRAALRCRPRTSSSCGPAERAREGGLKLTGEGGLLGRLTMMVFEGALEGGMDDHLGYSKHDPAGRDGGNSRNGHGAKTVIIGAGPVKISAPLDWASTLAPRIVAKRQASAGKVIADLELRPRGWPLGAEAAQVAPCSPSPDGSPEADVGCGSPSDGPGLARSPPRSLASRPSHPAD